MCWGDLNHCKLRLKTWLELSPILKGQKAYMSKAFEKKKNFMSDVYIKRNGVGIERKDLLKLIPWVRYWLKISYLKTISITPRPNCQGVLVSYV